MIHATVAAGKNIKSVVCIERWLTPQVFKFESCCFIYLISVILYSQIPNRECIGMVLKPQDILVLLKLAAIGDRSWAYNSLAVELSMSPSEVHSAIKRAISANLAIQKQDMITPSYRNLEEFIIHGLRYVFVPERGGLLRGMPTGHAAAPLKEFFVRDGEPPPVWPDPSGEVRGMSFSPLYKSAPKASRIDSDLYELLVLADAIRGGQARERAFAIDEIKKRLAQ